ncbi:chorismate-binding protein [uncultured Cytophaga sp.]|uniref:chorismate-binding protein n=1 Tax=uncultured Cytophaga sp. TaxID=160238 RepID=UPI0026378ED5|nr:chorismate-binding protein [uncultured Cytophaga sp.]
MNYSSSKIIDSITSLSKEKLIKGSLCFALEHGYSLACWSKPESSKWDILLDQDATLLSEDRSPSIHTLESGYLIAPFNSNKKKYLIKNNMHIVLDKTITIQIKDGSENAFESFETYLNNTDTSITHFLKKHTNTEETTSEFYISGVDKAKQCIQDEKFQKVVLSRSKTIDAPVEALEKVLLELRASYPHSCIAAFYQPEIGLWITATPELLLTTDAAGTFKTVALAGTQKYNPAIPVRDVSWTHKEIEEQALVSRYIIGCFKTIRLRNYVEIGPRTIQAGNILHLKTEFTAHTTEVNMSEIGTTMLELLHPTSAVCGMPKVSALDFIAHNESFDRKLFSGYSGPVNIEKETFLFVTLRCANIHADKITLYAGAGITADSDAEKEFEETELKMNVIGAVFSKLTI